MKIGKIITFLLLSCMFITSLALGQGRNESANVKITLVKALQISEIQGDLDFGELLQTGASATVERTPDQGILFSVNGSPGKNVVVDYQNTLLNNTSDTPENPSNSTIEFVPQINTTYSDINYSNAEPVSNGGSYELENKDGDGVLYLWVGGAMDIDSELSHGDYSGEFSVSVSY